jgi:hypothetical protein
VSNAWRATAPCRHRRGGAERQWVA